MNSLNLPDVNKLNTAELEMWLDPFWWVRKYCRQILDWAEFDKIKGFFSHKNKKEAFQEEYYDENIIFVPQLDGSSTRIAMSTIINWWMWTNISSRNMVLAMNNIWFGWHISSIWLWNYYFNEKYKWFNELNKDDKFKIIKNEFDSIFKNELKMPDELIEKHFFKCEDLWVQDKNTRFNWELWNERIHRMMDLVAIYKETMIIKWLGWDVWINVMYKTSSYIAATKIAILAWIDYITTAAWNPEKNPKEFLKEFYEDMRSIWLKFRIPAFWLLISSSKILKDLDYNYYIFEEWKKAGWHIIRFEDKITGLKKVKEIFNKVKKRIPPIYAAGWIYSNLSITEAFRAWFNWVQIWTNMAVSQEAVNWEWEQFKKTLISGNHLWFKSDIDELSAKNAIKNELVAKRYERMTRTKVVRIIKEQAKEKQINFTWEDIEIITDYFYKVVYNNFYEKDIEKLSDDQFKLLELVSNFIQEKFGWNEKKIYEALKSYWNSLKLIKEFKRFYEENPDKVPTHMVFDSTVWFEWRTRITPKLYKVLLWKLKSSSCVNCLVDCILAWRWNVKPFRWSTFCIHDWLNQIWNWPIIAFSGRSTVPYPEIRNIKDIMAYYMGYYIHR